MRLPPRLAHRCALLSLAVVPLAVPLAVPLGAPLGAQQVRRPPSGASKVPASAARPAPARARAAATPTQKPPATRASTPADTAPSADALRATRSVSVHEGPDGRALATLAPGTVVTPLAREGGWVRVRLEAWIPERALAPADTTVRTQLSAADLRADPEGTRGRLVRWEVELLAFQVADALRRELVPEEPYLLARGPGGENAMLYLALPPSLVPTARRLAPLTHLLVTARVRSGRSMPVGVPVLDILTLTPVRPD